MCRGKIWHLRRQKFWPFMEFFIIFFLTLPLVHLSKCYSMCSLHKDLVGELKVKYVWSFRGNWTQNSTSKSQKLLIRQLAVILIFLASITPVIASKWVPTSNDDKWSSSRLFIVFSTPLLILVAVAGWYCIWLYQGSMFLVLSCHKPLILILTVFPQNLLY